MSTPSEILLGLGNSLDYDMVWRPEAICALATELGIDRWPEPPTRIRDQRDLVSAILAYAAAGTGTEAAVDSAATIVSVAERIGFRESLGGTGVRAGRIVALLGVGCTVHLTSVSPRMQSLLWPGARFLAARTATADYPHLIVQYTADRPLTIGGITRTPPRPNRLIFVNDPDNAELPLATELPAAVAASAIWLTSGLNAITEPTVLASRLAQVESLLRTRPAGSWAVYEDAGFHRRDFAATTLRTLARGCDVVGMNEDEFAAHLGAPVDLADPAAVGRGLISVARRWDILNLVVHTAHWAAAVGPQAERLRPALAEGVLAGAARFAYGDAMTRADLARLSSAPVSADGAAVAAGLARAGVTAVAGVDLHPPAPVTVGLGDSFVGGFLAGLQRSGVPAERAGGPPLLVGLEDDAAG